MRSNFIRANLVEANNLSWHFQVFLKARRKSKKCAINDSARQNKSPEKSVLTKRLEEGNITKEIQRAGHLTRTDGSGASKNVKFETFSLQRASSPPLLAVSPPQLRTARL